MLQRIWSPLLWWNCEKMKIAMLNQGYYMICYWCCRESRMLFWKLFNFEWTPNDLNENWWYHFFIFISVLTLQLSGRRNYFIFNSISRWFQCSGQNCEIPKEQKGDLRIFFVLPSSWDPIVLSLYSSHSYKCHKFWIEKWIFLSLRNCPWDTPYLFIMN